MDHALQPICDLYAFAMQVVASVLALISTCVTAWIGFKLIEARADRELKFRSLELQLHAEHQKTRRTVTNGASHDVDGP